MSEEIEPGLRGKTDTDKGPRIRRIFGFFIDSQGKLRRGARIKMVDESGWESDAYREHNTGRFFVISKPKQKDEEEE